MGSRNEAQWQLEIQGQTLYLDLKTFSLEGESRDEIYPHLVAGCMVQLTISNFTLYVLCFIPQSGWTMELRVGNKYRLGRKIGSGSFGDIYLGEFLLTVNVFFDFCFITG